MEKETETPVYFDASKFLGFFVFISILASCAQLILLSVLLDSFEGVDFIQLGIPAWIISFLGSFIGIFYAIYYAVDGKYDQSLIGIGLFFLSQGYGWSQFALLRKFEFNNDMTYSQSLAPFFIGAGLAAIAILLASIYSFTSDNGYSKHKIEINKGQKGM